jgi:hypothetical protein
MLIIFLLYNLVQQVVFIISLIKSKENNQEGKVDEDLFISDNLSLIMASFVHLTILLLLIWNGLRATYIDPTDNSVYL